MIKSLLRAARLAVLMIIATWGGPALADDQDFVVGYAVFDALRSQPGVATTTLDVNARGTPAAASGSVDYEGFFTTRSGLAYGRLQGEVECLLLDQEGPQQRRAWLNGHVTAAEIPPGEVGLPRFSLLIYEQLDYTQGGQLTVSNQSLYLDMAEIGTPFYASCYQHGRYLYTGDKQRGRLVIHDAQ